MRIAVLGMGRMGQAVAGRLLSAGHDVAVWNRTPGKAGDLVTKGAVEATSITAAVSDAELALTSLRDDDAVLAVACGEGGIRDALPTASAYVDASTVSPATSEELDAAFPLFVAMPILGSPAATAAGQATYLAGARPHAAHAIDSLFPVLSASVRRYESPPLAATAKLAVNLLLLAGVAALAESVTVGRAGGLTDEQVRDLLGSTPMLAPGLKNRFEGVLTGEQEAWWTAAMGAKDARLAAGVARQAGVALPTTEQVRALYEQVAGQSPTADIAAVARLYRH